MGEEFDFLARHERWVFGEELETVPPRGDANRRTLAVAVFGMVVVALRVPARMIVLAQMIVLAVVVGVIVAGLAMIVGVLTVVVAGLAMVVVLIMVVGVLAMIVMLVAIFVILAARTQERARKYPAERRY
ncbi:MAG: hypothetical protein AAGF12_03695 [Myxococcota bacterium]